MSTVPRGESSSSVAVVANVLGDVVFVLAARRAAVPKRRPTTLVSATAPKATSTCVFLTIYEPAFADSSGDSTATKAKPAVAATGRTTTSSANVSSTNVSEVAGLQVVEAVLRRKTNGVRVHGSPAKESRTEVEGTSVEATVETKKDFTTIA